MLHVRVQGWNLRSETVSEFKTCYFETLIENINNSSAGLVQNSVELSSYMIFWYKCALLVLWFRQIVANSVVRPKLEGIGNLTYTIFAPRFWSYIWKPVLDLTFCSLKMRKFTFCLNLIWMAPTHALSVWSACICVEDWHGIRLSGCKRFNLVIDLCLQYVFVDKGKLL